MALSKINTGGLAANAVDNTILDLAGDYAFTGTISGAGSMALVHSETATSGSSFEWTGASTDYDQYLVYFNIDPSADVALNLRTYDNAGTPALNTGASDYGHGGVNEGGGSAHNGNTAASITIHSGAGGDAANEFMTGHFFFLNPMNSDFFTSLSGCVNADNTSNLHIIQWFAGQRLAAEQNKGFSLYLSTGTFTNASIKIFGMG